MNTLAAALAVVLVLGACTGEVSTTTPSVETEDSAAPDEDVAVTFWQSVADGNIDAATAVVDPASTEVVDLARFLSSLTPGVNSVDCQEGVERICVLDIADPLFRSGEATVDISQGRIVDLAIPSDMSAAIDNLAAWAREYQGALYEDSCSAIADDEVPHNETCGAYLSELVPAYLSAEVVNFFDGIAEKDMTVIREMVGETEGAPYNAEQLQNVFRFSAITNLVIPGTSCSTGAQGPTLDVICHVGSAHPLLDRVDMTWRVGVEGGEIVDADVAPYQGMTNRFSDLYKWANENHPEPTESVCGLAGYGSNEIVTGVTEYALNDRCATQLTNLIGEYFASTQPDHAIAVVWRLAETFNRRDVEAVLSLYADDAELFNYQGIAEIRDFIMEEMGTGLTFKYKDFMLNGDKVCALDLPLGFFPSLTLTIVVDGKITFQDDQVAADSCY